MKSILVPTDFSTEANYALDFARQLAQRHRSSITVLHVVEQPSAPYLTAVSGGVQDQIDNAYILRLIEKVKSQLEVVTSELHNERIEAKYEVKIGNPFGKISDMIKSRHHDLIVMGTKGTSGVDEVLVGSNTEKVIRHAQCPVITMKEPLKWDEIKNVVFAANFFEYSDRLAIDLKHIQSLFNAKFHLLNVITPGNFVTQRKALGCLVDFARDHQLQDYTVNTYSDVSEEDGIRHFAEDQSADMIVMATHGRRGIGHLLFGSLSERVVNHSVIPVTTVPLKVRQKNPVKDVVL